MLKIIYMGTPPLAATILQKLCEDLYPPVAIVTQTAKATGRGHKITPSAVEDLGRRLDLNVFTTLNVNAHETFSLLKTFNPDLILVAAFGQILKEEILNLPKLGCFNVHGSLLPKYRGAAPIQRAIYEGEKTTGVTIQRIVRKLDAGDIVLKKEISIDSEETSGQLMDRLAHLGGEALVEAVRLIESGKATFTPQDESLVTYAKKIEKGDAILDFNLPALKLANQIRALQPWPVGQAVLGKTRVKIFKAEIVSPSEAGLPGDILTDHKTFLLVHCGERTALSLTEIQPENRKRLKIHEFLQAFRGNFPFNKIGTADSHGLTKS
ncbi:MAG: methionyl-tRNA formyltransferase [Deltaproteobacteria bacterium]|nr:methionyl-tRNA formyltransferase [Deltaproteobacteria bacterium]